MKLGELMRLSATRRARPGILVLGAALMALLAPAGSPVAAAEDYLSGIDVSHWQGRIRWAEVAADGVQFVIAKATEGRIHVDEEYAGNRERAEANGLAFTAYHFAHPDKTADDALLEANNFIDTAALADHNLLPVLDLEDHGGLRQRRLRRWVKAWLAQVETRLGVKAMIYASPSFWKERMGNSRWFANNGYPLWIAHWQVDRPRVPAANWSGLGWTLWQHSDCGSVAGIDGCVDLDRLRGTDIDALRIGNRR